MTNSGTITTTPIIPANPWKGPGLPKRILAIRLQAMGDMVITLPYLQHLKKMLPPGTRLDLLTREEVADIPRNIVLFERVYSIKGGRNVKKQFVYAGLMLPGLLLKQYDVVIDLQDNILSRFIYKSLTPKAWALFDRFSPIAAGESTRLTIEAIGLGVSAADTNGFIFKEGVAIEKLLTGNGWDGVSELVLLNPAGAFPTRNWPIKNYLEFTLLWLEKYPQTQFLVIGVQTIAEKATLLQKQLGKSVINLVNKTTPVEAFALVQKLRFVLSEDSGLMHMAWVSGIPTLAMFGSTKSYRATPLGKHSLLLSSADLPCGNCMLEECAYGDTHCLTRYTAQFVFDKAVALVEQ